MALGNTLPPVRRIAYGDHPDQFGDLHLPADDRSRSAIILIHGGFWRCGSDRTLALMSPLARDLAQRGFVVWNIEYRRVGQEGGGWPGTLEDVAAAADAIAGIEGLDSSRVITVGHSAGGHLALWLAARHRIAAGQPGAAPLVRPCGAVSQAGVTDLERGAVDGLGSGACMALLGGTPEALPDRYAVASPAALLPLGVPQLLVHGGRDDDVPPAQSRAYAEAARAAGDVIELVEIAAADHFDVIAPEHESWSTTCRWLDDVFA